MKNFSLGLVALAAVAGTAEASDQIGIYAKITKVIYAPNDTQPESAKIYGTFAFADVPGGVYQPAQTGYLHYKLVPGKEALTRAEWADLKNMAGSADCVGFGQRRKQLGTPHRVTTETQVQDADAYPLGFGLAKVRANHPECKALVQAVPGRR